MVGRASASRLLSGHAILPPLNERQLMDAHARRRLNEKSIAFRREVKPRVEEGISPEWFRVDHNLRYRAWLTDPGSTLQHDRHLRDASIAADKKQLASVGTPARTPASGLRHAQWRRRARDSPR
jgi:hypothetical protein